MFNRLIFALFVAALLTSCATTPPTTPPMQTSWENRTQSLSRINRWQLSGKVALQTAQTAGSASIDWTQNRQNYTISLYGPLGSNGLTLQGHPGVATVTTADGKHASASSAEQLLMAEWGWNLPVSNLIYWVRGLPVPNIPNTSKFDSFHRITSLSQQGWLIQYLGYTRVGKLELPNRINISSNALKTKIIIYTWNI